MTAAIVGTFAGMGAAAHADDPSITIDLSGLSGLTSPSGGPADWSRLASAVTPAAAPPQSPVEAAAPVTASAPSAPAPASVPETSAAPAIVRLPSTGSGGERGHRRVLLAAIVAAVGVACIGASRVRRGASGRA
jgi:hypothetical protein